MVNWERKYQLKKRIFVDGFLRHANRLATFFFNRKMRLLTRKIIQSTESTTINIKEFLPLLQFGLIIPPEIHQFGRTEDIVNEILLPFYTHLTYYLNLFELDDLVFSIPYIKPLELIEEQDSILLHQIIQYQKKDRWIPADPSWVPHFVELLSSESLIRQLFYGQRYLITKFRTISKTKLFFPDLILSQSYLQILSQLGIENGGFLPETNQEINLKISTMDNFSPINWKELKNLDFSDHKIKKLFPVLEIFMNSHDITQSNKKMKANHYRGPNFIKLVQRIFWQQTDYAINKSLLDYYQSRSMHISNFPFNNSPLFRLNLPIWINRPYLLKECNYVFENLILQAEILSLFSGLLGRDHFQTELEDDWHLGLTLQESRLQAGSICLESLRDAFTNYMQLFRHLHSSIENLAMNIGHALRIETKEHYYTIINTLGWARKGYVIIGNNSYQQAFDHNNIGLLSQRVKISPYLNNLSVQTGIHEIQDDYLNYHSPTYTTYRKEQLQKDLSDIGQDMFKSQILNKTLSESEARIDLETLDQKFEKLIHPLPEYLLIEVPEKSSPLAFGLCNFKLSRNTVGTIKNSSKIENSTEYFQFSNNYYTIKISKKTGEILHLSSSSSQNIINTNQTLYDITKVHHNMNLKSKILEFIQQNEPIFDETSVPEFIILEKGPIRITIEIIHPLKKEFGRLVTRFSFYHNSPLIFGETLALWKDPSLSLNLVVFNNKSNNYDDIKLLINTNIEPELKKIDLNEEFNRFKKSEKENFKNIHISYNEGFLLQKKHLSNNSSEDVAIFTPTLNLILIKEQTIEIPLIQSSKLCKPDKQMSSLDFDVKTRNNWIDIGIHRIPWILYPDFSKSKMNNFYQISKEIEHPLLAIASHAMHSAFSFFSVDKNNVILSHIKEADLYLREAPPDWYYQTTMADIPIILRLQEISGEKTLCKIKFSDKIRITKANYADLLERISNGQNNYEQLTIKDQTIEIPMEAYSLKTIYMVGKIPLESD